MPVVFVMLLLLGLLGLVAAQSVAPTSAVNTEAAGLSFSAKSQHAMRAPSAFCRGSRCRAVSLWHIAAVP